MHYNPTTMCVCARRKGEFFDIKHERKKTPQTPEHYQFIEMNELNHIKNIVFDPIESIDFAIYGGIFKCIISLLKGF